MRLNLSMKGKKRMHKDLINEPSHAMETNLLRHGMRLKSMTLVVLAATRCVSFSET